MCFRAWFHDVSRTAYTIFLKAGLVLLVLLRRPYRMFDVEFVRLCMSI